LRNTRKTECGAILFLIRLAVRAAPFALLSIETAKNWKRPAERSTVARMLDHGPMGRVCTGKRDELNEYFKTNPASGNDLDVLRHLHVITNAFVEMLQHRHTADYNRAIKMEPDRCSGQDPIRRSGLRKLARDPGRTRGPELPCDAIAQRAKDLTCGRTLGYSGPN
jgi:hypothetical protein